MIPIRFIGINQTQRSYIRGNLFRFLIKPNMSILTFLGIQVYWNHISKNLDARVDIRFPEFQSNGYGLMTRKIP